ncbi:protein Tob1-like [Phlebotomus argentipes]|uniref:protein Tob1-like n=1 Tax=Phlebotomus argentipes TaxID=94469 RepID=UPI0028937D96|nr:protein Tob1-like [Phlebotomus argentipes]XP_059618824.1 protein Tob1-like [Phlebotomus argentipes]
MHIEIQVALNFVISYLYNKLPRRRVNLFGEELEKALKDKFQGHWYPEKPFKGSAFRCLKTGDPTDAVLDRAARESGVPINDILENLPSELAVWVDPGEVSYRIGEKGAIKILFSEASEHHEDSSSADREVTKTFNPEAQCFRPIDAVNSSFGALSISPKTTPNGSPLTSTGSPTFKNGALTTSPAPGTGAPSFLPRTQAPLTFTTATFAQTKFGSTKLKTSSKRANRQFPCRMSPTEFSNYIKQRAMQQQLHHSHNHNGNSNGNHLGPIGPASPSRSISPNPLTLGLGNDPYFFQNLNMGMYPQFGGPRSVFGDSGHFGAPPQDMYSSPMSKFNSYQEPHNFYGSGGLSSGQQGVMGGGLSGSPSAGLSADAPTAPGSGSASGQGAEGGSPGTSDSAKLLDGLNSFYSNAGPYQHLLVAN